MPSVLTKMYRLVCLRCHVAEQILQNMTKSVQISNFMVPKYDQARDNKINNLDLFLGFRLASLFYSNSSDRQVLNEKYSKSAVS